jgi:hypothetical protein
VLHVADDADYLYPLRLFVVAAPDARVGEALPDGLLARPVALGHRAADDRHARRILYVALVECATAHQRDAHRLEVAGRDEA